MQTINALDDVPSGAERYRILSDTGTVLFDNVDIQFITTLIQTGTIMNKQIFDIIDGNFIELNSLLELISKYNTPTLSTGNAWILHTGLQIPAMSSASQGGYIVTRSSENGTDYAWKAFDRNASTWWSTPNKTLPQWIAIQLPSAIKLSKYAIRGYSTLELTSWTLQGSNNGSTWTDIETRTSQSVGDAEQTFTLSTVSASYLYFRIQCLAANGAGGFVIREIQIIEWYSYDVVNLLSLTSELSAYITNQIINIKVPNGINTSYETFLNINTLGSKLIVDNVVSGNYYELTYNGTSFDKNIISELTLRNRINDTATDANSSVYTLNGFSSYKRFVLLGNYTINAGGTVYFNNVVNGTGIKFSKAVQISSSSSLTVQTSTTSATLFATPSDTTGKLGSFRIEVDMETKTLICIFDYSFQGNVGNITTINGSFDTLTSLVFTTSTSNATGASRNLNLKLVEYEV